MLKNCLLLIHIGRRCLPRWNPCVRSLRFPIFSAIEGHNRHTKRMYKLYRDRDRSSGGGALSASRGWWWGRGRLEDERCHKVVMSTHFYSCRHLLGLQVHRFVEQQQVSLKWITQGLSNSGRKRSKLSLSSNPAITIQKVSCVPNTPNTLVRCIGALVRRRDSEIQVVWMIRSSKCNLE